MSTNDVWQRVLQQLVYDPDYEPSPRGKETREVVPGQYTVPMPAYLTLAERGVNLPFMLAEPAWILSGSNRAADLEPYMKAYRNFSDDGVFLRGAYGPKITDQLSYVVDSLDTDPDSRQAYLNIWRERPAPARDIACTTGMQFLLRDGRLHAVVTMRSQDIVQGFTYDVFTFSMVARAVVLLLDERRSQRWDGWVNPDKEEHPFVPTTLGKLTVTAGSLHLYRDPFGKGDDQFEKAAGWIEALGEDDVIEPAVVAVMQPVPTYEDLIGQLYARADLCRDLSTALKSTS